jgi:hypothetical protein
MGHLKFVNDISYLRTNVLGQFVPNHKKQITIIEEQNQSRECKGLPNTILASPPKDKPFIWLGKGPDRWHY